MKRSLAVPSARQTRTQELPSALAPGHLLNHTFRLVHAVAEGGMGVVFLTTHERLPGLFAVKTPRPDLPCSEEGAARLLQEAEVLATLNHPNVVRVFDFNSTADGTPYLVMEFLEGRNLNEILYSRVLHPWETVEIVRQVAAGLEAAHARGIIHRDLKPENVFIATVPGQEDVIKLIDFGVSKVTAYGRIDTRSGIVGTPNYMAPEQAKDERDRVDGRVDQFALAVMTFEMLAGVRPFTDDDPVKVLSHIVNQAPPPLAGLVGWPTAAVQQVLSRGMEKNPDDRYPNVSAYAQALEAAIQADIGGLIGGLPGGLDVVRRHDELIRESRQARPRRAANISQAFTPVLSEHAAGVASAPVSSSATSVHTGARTKNVRPAWWTARRCSRLLVVAAAAAMGASLLRPRVGPLLVGWRSGARVQTVPQTRASGVKNTVAPPGSLQPRSSDSGSAQPKPP